MSGFVNNLQWYTFRNDSGETIPAHAFIRADNGSKDTLGSIWISGKKPNADGLGNSIYVNGPLDVPDGKFGLCTNSQVVPIAYDNTGSPAAGDVIGPKSGSWLGWKDYAGAKILTFNDANETKRVAWINRTPCSQQNSWFVITLFGPPTGGTWSIDSWQINGTTASITGISYSVTASSLKTSIEGHGGVGSGNVDVTGGPGNSANFLVKFQSALANKFIPTPVINYGSLTGTGVGGLAYPVQIGRPA